MAKAVSKTPNFLSRFTSREKNHLQVKHMPTSFGMKKPTNQKLLVFFFIAESTHSHSAKADYYSANTPSLSTSVGYTSPQLNFGLAKLPALANGILVDKTQAKA